MKNNTDKKYDTQCPLASTTLLLYLYGEAEDPAAYEAHLNTCDECSGLLKSHRQVLQAYRAEVIATPHSIGWIPKRSLTDRILDFFSMPSWQPALAGVAVLLIMAAGIFWHFNSVQKPLTAHASVTTPFSDSEMDKKMDEIEADLDDMFAMNDGSKFFSSQEPVSGQEVNAGEAENYNEPDLINELDDIQSDIYTF